MAPKRFDAARASIDAAHRTDELQRALDNSLRTIARLRKSREDLASAIYQAADDNFKAMRLAPVARPKFSPNGAGEEVAVPVLADWQLGKVTPSYSSPICEKRIDLYAEKVLQLTGIQRKDHPVKRAHVWVLGDIIEGITIFPGQHWLVDSSLYRQITLDGPRILGNFLRRMLANFESVHVTAVIGNHGRLGKRGEYDPETNGDRMLYRITQQLLAHEERLTWSIPDGMGERHWYAIDRIGNYSCLLFHGDQLGGRMLGTLTMIGAKRMINGWKGGAIPEKFDDVTFGHWHQLSEIALSGRTIARCAGSPESYNTFAQEALAAMSDPGQRLQFAHPKKGRITSEHKVWL